MTKDKTPETAEEAKAKIEKYLSEALYPFANGPFAGQPLRSWLGGATNTAIVVDAIYQQTSLLQKENEAKQQLLDEMAEAISKAQQHLVSKQVHAILDECLTKYQNQKEGK